MLSAEDRKIVGHSKRVTLPLGDALTLRMCLDDIRAWCHEIDRLTRMVGTPDYTERRVMMLCSIELDCLNTKIRETARQNGVEIDVGRPKTAPRKERGGDEGGTVIVTGFSRSQDMDEMRRRG